MYEHNALGYRSSLALCLTKVRSSRSCCSATALIMHAIALYFYWEYKGNIYLVDLKKDHHYK